MKAQMPAPPSPIVYHVPLRLPLDVKGLSLASTSLEQSTDPALYLMSFQNKKIGASSRGRTGLLFTPSFSLFHPRRP